jgi:DNA-directed RNA polymerase subunit RPC12/RpoP
VSNPRRAYNADGSVIAPMDLANMRENGVRSVEARCEACGHEAVVNCDALPADLPVPDVALRLRCSGCGSKRIVTKPDWTERPRIA